MNILNLAFILIGCASNIVRAQILPLEVDSTLVDSQTLRARGPHLVYTSEGHGNGKLLISLGGTRSIPRDFGALHQVALELGYQVIAIDYPNSVVTTACQQVDDEFCYDKFRREIVEGDSVSSLVEVNKANSIQFRILSLLTYLHKQDSRWSVFYKNGALDWGKVVLVGHSQGSGHAAYLAKLYAVDRVFMIGGPQDSTNSIPAPWIRAQGATSGDRHFGLLHINDFFGAELQKIVQDALVNGSDEVNANHVLVSEKEVTDGHMEIISSQFSEEWRRFLR